MKFIDVTNSHSRLVFKQLENTDAHLVKVYTAGNSTVIYTEAPRHNEILIVNKKRNVQDSEIQETLAHFIKKMDQTSYDPDSISVIELEGLVEISIPIKSKLVEN